jgi:hypothetical protein
MATLATSLAALAYGAIDLRSASPWIIAYAPLWQGVLVAAPAGAVVGIARRKVTSTLFVTTTTIFAGLLAAALGELTIGHSPHFSHERAAAFLTISWTVVALAISLFAVAGPETSAGADA